MDLVVPLLLTAASMLMLLLVRRLPPAAAVCVGGRAAPSSEAARPSVGTAWSLPSLVTMTTIVLGVRGHSIRFDR